MKKRNSGYSMVELLVSTAILGIVLSLASQGILLALKYHRNQQSVVEAQSKLRQVNEIMSQEVRSAILGGIFDQSANSVSFMLLDGGAGYQVTSVSSSEITFAADVSSTTDLGFSGQALLVDKAGNANIVTISSISSKGSNLYGLNHACSSSLASLSPSDSLLFAARAVGFDHDSNDKTLYRTDSSGRKALAFDMSTFSIAYDPPVGEVTRLNLTAAAEYKTVGNETKERSYTGQIDLPEADASFSRRIKAVTSCN